MRDASELDADRSQADMVLDAARDCLLRWGIAKTTMDDIVDESGVSRATIYRLFPGGRDVLFEALRVREQSEFLANLAAAVAPVVEDPNAGVEEAIATAVAAATQAMRTDESLVALMADVPGVYTLNELTMEGFPRIVRIARTTLSPLLRIYVQPATADRLIDVLARLTISYFLAPVDGVDLGDLDQARRFITPIATALIPSDELGTIDPTGCDPVIDTGADSPEADSSGGVFATATALPPNDGPTNKEEL